MSLKFRNALIALFLCLIVVPCVKAESIKREVRAVWLTTVWRIDWPTNAGTSSATQQKQKDQMIQILDLLQDANFNTVYFQVRSMCDAMYKSSYEAWSSFLTDSRGADPHWDPLDFVVAECHKRGMECYAWVNPLRFSTGTKWSTPQDQFYRDKGWLLSYTNGEGSTTTVLNPGIPEALQRVTDICREIVTNYNIDGLVFDDYFYPSGIPTSSAAADYTLWKKSNNPNFGNWRRENINTMVRNIYNMIQTVKPYVRFGISPAGVACTSSSVANGHGVKPCPTGSDWQYSKIFSDPVAWIKEGTIDFISPQLYWKTNHSTNGFGPLTKWWSEIANQFGRHHYASHSISFFGSSNTTADWEEVGKQIQYSRDYNKDNAPGAVMYSTQFISGKSRTGFNKWLKDNKFSKPSLVPALDWKNHKTYGKVVNMKVNGSELTWSNADNNVRYSVYAIPNRLKPSEITSALGGVKADYLVAVTYNNSYSIPSHLTIGHYFGVCILDRFGNEFPVQFSNESSEPAPKVTLTSPVNGKMVKSPVTFQWSSAANVTYTIQVGTDATFSKIVAQQRDLTTNSVTMDLSDLLPETVYSWRVVTSQKGKSDTESATETFKTAPYDPISKATLLTPANGMAFAEDVDKVEFKWQNAAGCSYLLEVADNAEFNQPIYTKETTNTSEIVAFKYLKFNTTLYWRVKSSKPKFADSYSETWRFQAPSRPVADKAQLIAPANNATVNKDTNYEFNGFKAEKFVLQVSTRSDFSQVYMTISNGFEKNAQGNTTCALIHNQYANGTYYWRVISKGTNRDDNQSDVFSFKVTGSSAGGIEQGYQIKNDISTYDNVSGMSLNNLWMRSVADPYNNLTFQNNGAQNRGFCVIDHIVYVAGRNENSSASDCYIAKYNAFTGEYMGKLDLPASVQCSYYPCNDVMHDEAGNLLISNLTLNGDSYPVNIHQIDKKTGAATLVAECYTKKFGKSRIDHCAVFGDVNSGNFEVLAAIASNTTVVKWIFKNGKQSGKELQMEAQAYYPTFAKHFGIAPRVFPISETELFVNGGGIQFSRYNFLNGTLLDSFKSNPSLAAESTDLNGATFFTFMDKTYLVLPESSHSTDTGYRFKLIQSNADMVFASMAKRWVFPAKGMGKVNSSTWDALIDHEVIRDGNGRDVAVQIYVYVPGNGLAAYSMQKVEASGIVTEVAASETVQITYANGNISFDQTVDCAEVYNLSGMLVAQAKHVDHIALNATNGVYIVRCINNGKVTTKKILK